MGIYHGEESCNVLIYCNATILDVDFDVLETKEYSFFLGAELVRLEIEKNDEGNFLYGLYLDKKADTPLNRWQKTESRKNNTITFFLGAGMFTLVSILVYTFRKGL